jgi:hypothetical protein
VPVVVPRVELGEELRVDAEPEVDAGRGARPARQPRPALRTDRRDDELRDARRPRALDDPVAIGRELELVEVAVGVDQRGPTPGA